MERVRVLVSVEPRREYEVEFGDGGRVRVWTVFDRKPVNRRGFYQADNGARELRRDGPTALRAIKAASDILDGRHALAS